MTALPERIAQKIHVDESECWVWTASRNAEGYGRVSYGGRKAQLAHRVVYTVLVGPIPEGLTIDHLCRNRACVNPAHLEPVTMRENLRRGLSPTMLLHEAGVCKNGHPLSEGSFAPNGRRLGCKPCINAQKRAQRAARRAERK